MITFTVNFFAAALTIIYLARVIFNIQSIDDVTYPFNYKVSLSNQKVSKKPAF